MKSPILVWTLAALACATLAACATGPTQAIDVTRGTVIKNATIVNTRDGSLRPGMAIVIDGGKIQQIVASASVRTGENVKLIEGAQRYVIPGLLDMHTHAMPAADKQPSYWPLLIANGITGIREMAGSVELIQRARQLNVDRAGGMVDAPEVLLMPGDLLAGVPTAARAIQIVQQQKAMGADFIKLVGASPDATFAAVAEARKLGLLVAGHLPPSVPAVEASRAGFGAIEHLGSGMGILLDCATDEAEIRKAVVRGEGAPPVFSLNFVRSPMLFRTLDAPFYQRVLDSYSEEKCQALAQEFAKNATWQVPTLIRLRSMEFSSDALYRNDPHLAYIDKATRAQWEQLATQYAANVPAAAAATFRDFYSLQVKVTKLLKQNGVKMLAGSDLGGIWVIPGFSLHQEFRELARAGLTPLEILQMATLNGAEFLHRESTMGTVEPGKTADLVLLDANPLLDAANLGAISSVFLRGKYFSKADLDALRSSVARAYAN